MPPSGKRVRLAPGIYEDATGIQAQVQSGHGKDNTQRFLVRHFKSREETIRAAKRWQRRRLAELAKTAPERPVSQRGTLKADVPRALALIPKGDRRNGLDILLATWLETDLASKSRADITREDVKKQLAAWGSEGGRTGEGYAASTLNHRLSALRTVYRELDGPEAYDPTKGIGKFKEPEPEPRGVPIEVASAILARIKDRGGKKKPVLETKARIRLQVILFTGLPHATVMRIKPEHIDWTDASLLATPRRKGKGARARRLPLLPQAVEALREFDRTGCYGAFSTSPVRRAWIRARDAVVETIEDPGARALIAQLRPYDLRHSFLTEVFRHSGDHRSTGELGMHADDRSTHRYTLAAVAERMRLALAAVASSSVGSVPTAGNTKDSKGKKGRTRRGHRAGKSRK